VTGRKSAPTCKIKANSPERTRKWYNHFQELLGESRNSSENETNVLRIVDTTLPIETRDFSKCELLRALKMFKNDKATGIDNIPIEVWKSESLMLPLLNVCNKVLHGDKPKIWSQSTIVPIPKKGDISDVKNYRGISLTVIAAKVYNKMLLERIQPHIQRVLRMNQNGFRVGRTTLGQILTLRRLIEGIRSKNLPAIITFIDFSKAFDSVCQHKLKQIMIAYGIPLSIVNAIYVLYEDTEAKVISPDGETDFFQVKAGVLQGDTLAPFLFILVLDYALRQATSNAHQTGFTLQPRRSTRYPEVTITDADFADDIALCSDSYVKAQLLLERVEKAANDIGLHINEKKTEYIAYNLEEGIVEAINGHALKRVLDFKYLGSWINTSEKDLSSRIGLAWTAANKMDTIWKSDLNNELKVRFFRSTVENVLVYGSESWTLTREMERRLNGNYTRLLRKVQNVSYAEHKTNRELYGKLDLITDTIKARRLKYIGHVWRRDDKEPLHQLLLWVPQHGKRSRGRPHKTFLDQICEDTGLELDQLGEAMCDKRKWRDLSNIARESFSI